MTKPEEVLAQLTDTVPILKSDVIAIADILENYVDCPEVWGDTIHRLREALNED